MVSIEAIGCNPGTTQAILDATADDLLAVKANQSSLMGEIERFFKKPGADVLTIATDFDKGHGRTEERSVSVSTRIDWLEGERRFPSEQRFPQLAMIGRVVGRAWEKGKETSAVRFYVSSRPMTPQALIEAVCNHWAIEDSLHWMLDVTFGEDKARFHTEHGPDNMATIH